MLINDGKNTIYEDVITIDEVDYIGYGKPFNTYNSSNSKQTVTRITNEFVYSENIYFKSLTGGYNDKEGKSTSVDPYYGRLQHTPTSEGETISIFLKRMVYGIKVNIGDFFTHGTMNVLGKTITPTTKTVEELASPSDGYYHCIGYTNGYYFRLYNWYYADELDDARLCVSFSFSWTRDDGTTVEWKEQEYTFNRLKQTVINLDYYSDGNLSNGMNVTLEEWEIEEGLSYTHGEDQEDFVF